MTTTPAHAPTPEEVLAVVPTVEPWMRIMTVAGLAGGFWAINFAPLAPMAAFVLSAILMYGASLPQRRIERARKQALDAAGVELPKGPAMRTGFRKGLVVLGGAVIAIVLADLLLG